jgi:hypothetical protein
MLLWTDWISLHLGSMKLLKGLEEVTEAREDFEVDILVEED